MSRSASAAAVRIGLVLSGGGLRGASHLGVLQELTAQHIPIEIIVGASAGAIVAAYYAAVGLTLDELIADAAQFRGRHLLAHILNVRLHGRRSTRLTRKSGVIPERLAQLERATFDRLYHGVRALGVVCHDLASRRPRYFATGADRGVRLSDVVRASASIPFLLPSVHVTCPDDGVELRLTDGGVSDGLPVAFAQQPPLGATRLIVSDCRWIAGSRPSNSSRLVYLRPRLPSTGTLWAPASTLASAVGEGRRAVDADALGTIREWLPAAALTSPTTK